jgi:uncharacterized protein involved in exopolysaccharide biosynthesis
MSETAIQPNEGRADLALTMRDVVAPVFRQRRLATLLFLGIFLGAILTALLLPRKYEAEMKILVNRERVDAVVTPNPDSPVTAEPMPLISEEDLNSEVELLKSRDLLEKVVLLCDLESQEKSPWKQILERAGEWLRGRPMTGEERLARAVQTLEDRLVVDPLKKTTLIRVSYTARDPELAARVLQTLAVHYQEKHAAVHRPAGTFTFFEQETDHYRNELAIAEAQLTHFNTEQGIISAPDQKQLILQQLSQFEAELEQARANATEARERALALKSQARTTPERQVTQMKKLDNAQLHSLLESTLLSLELKRSELLMKYAPEYPLVQQVEKQISDAREAIVRAEKSPVEEVVTDRPPAQDWMATELAKAETDGAALEAQAIETARIVRHYREAAQKLDEKSVMQDDLVRNVKTAEENYLLYLHKREEARISDALDRKRIVNVSIAEAATVPALPTLHLAWVLIGGFFAAGIVSVGSAYAVDRLDPSFRTPGELGRYLEVKVLASIPENVKGQ